MITKQFKSIQRKAKTGQATQSDFELIPNIMDKIYLSKMNVNALSKQLKNGQTTRTQVSQAFDIYLAYANKQYNDCMEGQRKALERLNSK